MLGLDRSMSQPNLLHLAQLAAAAPISACGSEISESIASQNDVADMADLPSTSGLAALPGLQPHCIEGWGWAFFCAWGLECGMTHSDTVTQPTSPRACMHPQPATDSSMSGLALTEASFYAA